MKNYSHEAGSPAENKKFTIYRVLRLSVSSIYNTGELFSAEITSVIRLQK